MATMKASGACRALIREFEGCYLAAYRCPAGIPTIGVGHTRRVKMGDRCTVQQADVWLTEDLQDAEAAVNTLVKAPLAQQQFDALVSFAFNLGGTALAESTLLILLNKGNYKAAAEQFDRWVHSGGKKLAGLVRRRAAEKALFLDGLRSAT
ncbi:lysozyme [uncultured Massilia sp.]|uniref:lysozyme n=1 Tax=uncultured Massilia sp. TaxID=169973 RepID=UPI0025906831|nr:lysozyme [uncultured Massilia sp.]